MFINNQSTLRRIQKSSLLELIEKHYTSKELTPIYTEVLLPSQNRTLDPDIRITKKLIIKEFDAVFNDPALGKALFNTMSNPLKKAISFLTWSAEEELYNLEFHLGYDLTEIDRDATYRQDPVRLKKGIHWLLLIKDSYYSTYESNEVWKEKTLVSLPAALRQWFQTLLPKPAGYYLEPIETLPESDTDTIRTYRCDETIIEDFRVTADYILRGNLKFTKAENISKPCIRAIEKLTEGGEFFQNDGNLNKQLLLLRHEIFAGILSVIGNKRLEEMRKDTPNPRIILRELLDSLFGHSEWIHEFILTHLKETYGSTHQTDAATQLAKLFRSCDTKGWITIQNLTLHIQYQNINLEILSQCTTRLRQLDKYYSYQETIDITPSTVSQFYALPLLQGFPFLLAALGLAEIAYTTPPENGHYQRGANPFITPFDGFVAIRLTPLGNYAFRNTDEIKLKKTAKKRAEITLNPQRLTVTCRNVDPVTELALLKFMEKHSSGCYRLTRNSFMKGCTTLRDVQKRIEQFKRNITTELPPLWETFFCKIEESAVALKARSGYKIYQLTRSPELKEIFSTDPILIKKTTKVAGLQIAIHKKDLPAVTKHLKTLGYLIE